MSKASPDGFRKSSAVIICLSDQYEASENCKLELNYALRNFNKSQLSYVAVGRGSQWRNNTTGFRIVDALYIDFQDVLTPAKLSKRQQELLDNLEGKKNYVSSPVNEGFDVSLSNNTPLSLKSEPSTLKDLLKYFEDTSGGIEPVFISEGGFSTVYKVNLPKYGKYVAVKIMKSASNHYPASSEKDLLRQQAVTDLAKGMLFLHSQTPPILHGDLKADNALVDENGTTKIADFGFSRVMTEAAEKLSNFRSNGSFRWKPKERLDGAHLSKSVDMYAYGMTCYEVYSGKEPFEPLDFEQVYIALTRNQRPPRPNNITDEFWNLILRCWDSDSESRPQFKDVCLKLDEIVTGDGVDGEINQVITDSGFDGDGYTISIFVAYRDGLIREFDVETGEELRTFEGFQNRISAMICFSVSGKKYLIAGGDSNKILVWNVATTEKHTLKVSSEVTVISYSQTKWASSEFQTTVVYCGDVFGAISTWDAKTFVQGPRFEVMHDKYPVRSIAVSASGYLHVSTDSGHLHIWNLHVNTLLKSVNLGVSSIFSLLDSESMQLHAILGGMDGSLKKLAVKGSELNFEISCASHIIAISTIVTVKNSNHVYFGSDRGLYCWNFATNHIQQVSRRAHQSGCAISTTDWNRIFVIEGHNVVARNVHDNSTLPVEFIPVIRSRSFYHWINDAFFPVNSSDATCIC
ncbi:hypothetical protein HK098_002561 [Nowakowskiella sp. JEL0407]|nr:hypothetical protein HK098_002561 [Nowakowskiella sp. JEL0407]